MANFTEHFKKQKVICLSALVATIALLGIGVGVIFYLKNSENSEHSNTKPAKQKTIQAPKKGLDPKKSSTTPPSTPNPPNNITPPIGTDPKKINPSVPYRRNPRRQTSTSGGGPRPNNDDGMLNDGMNDERNLNQNLFEDQDYYFSPMHISSHTSTDEDNSTESGHSYPDFQTPDGGETTSKHSNEKPIVLNNLNGIRGTRDPSKLDFSQKLSAVQIATILQNLNTHPDNTSNNSKASSYGSNPNHNTPPMIDTPLASKTPDSMATDSVYYSDEENSYTSSLDFEEFEDSNTGPYRFASVELSDTVILNKGNSALGQNAQPRNMAMRNPSVSSSSPFDGSYSNVSDMSLSNNFPDFPYHGNVVQPSSVHTNRYGRNGGPILSNLRPLSQPISTTPNTSTTSPIDSIVTASVSSRKRSKINGPVETAMSSRNPATSQNATSNSRILPNTARSVTVGKVEWEYDDITEKPYYKVIIKKISYWSDGKFVYDRPGGEKVYFDYPLRASYPYRTSRPAINFMESNKGIKKRTVGEIPDKFQPISFPQFGQAQPNSTDDLIDPLKIPSARARSATPSQSIISGSSSLGTSQSTLVKKKSLGQVEETSGLRRSSRIAAR